MNAFYVTVSIPLLLVLVGFNHAHGLSTFGKSQTQPPTNLAKARKCTDQSACSFLRNTTCLRGMCLCGDNHPPTNNDCTSQLGPNHICTKTDDCVDNADCISIKEVKLPREVSHLHQHPELSICVCQEGYQEVGATCGGRMNLVTIPFMLVAVAIYKIFN